ncbi:2-methoxy-6-polyprenyl-1,4-benzoquinol methylase, mitochondrial isoform X2 [Selaginella moellendorffii]|uniref:2-methoxy-6-polyprenyl-1,4-benzoquinol methylase, mitochondrial isoform X2 n=1 Tax=Selaginella moellendorffii TaxID=88036 RepID=UPI000D1C8BA9|nr:2-methoxy-6-polyprenyl-1,4-benzoquinol methylase, mitochondrial isoform X2 [Selaginella moellendorffii]|eukprot:XP_024539232.1 2-methoxy-6-polyprenyl-1,4-benzoquinol methylase, mitochondrial isoform X2 [Selaginella moellendorffii]
MRGALLRAAAGKALRGRWIHSERSSSGVANFGFREVPEDEKAGMVGAVFSSVASNYDLMNDIMSGGLHRLWKDRLVSELQPFPGMQHLDVAGGTGDIAFRVLDTIYSKEQRSPQKKEVNEKEVVDETRVYVCDINASMLDVGRQRAKTRGLGELPSLVWVEGDAEALTFADDSMDGYTIAFGIRNVTHIDKALREAHRVLKRGGRFLCLELSHVETPIFKQIYDFYSFSVIPAIGQMVAKDRNSYQYLVESIRRFPKQDDFARMIINAGFSNVQYENLVQGVVAIHSGFKL